MRKILVMLSSMGFFSLAFAASPALAGDSNALIEKLIEKGVLNESEAEEISKDMKDQSDVAKALKGISIGGTYFLEYYHRDYDDNTDSFSSFRVQRAYVTVKKKFTKWFSSRVTGDITYDSERGKTDPVVGPTLTDTGSVVEEIGNEFRLKYAYGKFDFKRLFDQDLRLESEFGLVHTASDDYDAALWPYRAQGKHFLDRHSIMSSADYGMNVRLTFGEMDKDFQKNVSKKYAGKWGGVWAGIYNGPGYGHPSEANDDKVVEALVYVRPFNQIDILNGIRIGYHVARGEADGLLTTPKQYPDWEIDQFLASFQHKDCMVMFQKYSGKGEDNSSDQNDRDGYNIAGYVKMPFDKKMKVFLRYDVYDDNDTQPNIDEETTIYGVSYDLAKGVMAWAAMEEKDYESTSSTDCTDTQVGLAVSF